MRKAARGAVVHVKPVPYTIENLKSIGRGEEAGSRSGGSSRAQAIENLEGIGRGEEVGWLSGDSSRVKTIKKLEGMG